MASKSVAMSEEDAATFEVTRKVAAIEGCEVSDLPPLFRVIDTEAVNSLASSQDARLQFNYFGHEVLIEDGEVTVDPTP